MDSILININYLGKISTLKCNYSFKSLLNQLNETIPNLPEAFILYYSHQNNPDRCIYIGCPADYRVFIEKITRGSFHNNVPLLILQKTEQAQPQREDIEQIENQQLQLSRQFSQVLSEISDDTQEQLARNLDRLDLSSRHSYEEPPHESHNKCQFCYEDLQPAHARCCSCYFFKICLKCNKSRRAKEHGTQHVFLILQNHHSWNEIKQRACDVLGKQKASFKFKLHQRHIHESIACDICQVNPIIGQRFKCIDCADYDQCQKCFELDGHRKQPHTLVQLDFNFEFINFLV